MPPEKKPYFDNLVSHKDEIRGIVKPLAEQGKLKYDPEEFKEAPSVVRLKLGTEWMKKLAERMPEGKKIEPNKIWGSLGIDPDHTSHDDAINIIKHFQSTHGLDADGIIGPKTLEELDRASGDDGSFSTPIKMLDAEGQDTGKVYSKGAREATPPEEGAEEKADKPKLTPEQKAAKKLSKKQEQL